MDEYKSGNLQRELTRIKKKAKKKHIEIPRVSLGFTKQEKKKYAKEMRLANKNAAKTQTDETISVIRRKLNKIGK